MWLVDDLPLHPLVVHLPVVLLPLIAAGLAVYVVAPRWRGPLGPVLAALAFGAAGAAVLAVATGEQLGDALRRADELDAHRALGERSRAYAIVLAFALTGLVGYARRPARPDARVTGAAAAVAVLAVGAAAAVGLTGHTGAQLAWKDKLAATKATPTSAAALVSETSAPMPAAAPPPAPTASPPGPGVIDVVVGEWALVTSAAEAPPAETTFRFRNRGSVSHALRIRSAGSGKHRLEWRSAPVQPGSEATLTVALPAGSFELDCPLEDGHGEHDALGMQAPLQVRAGAEPAGSAAPAPAQTNTTPPTTPAVTIATFAFSPSELHVRAGERVSWTNRDPAPHTATGDGWDTGHLAPGVTGAVTFDRAGTFPYVCGLHPAMQGAVVVT